MFRVALLSIPLFSRELFRPAGKSRKIRRLWISRFFCGAASRRRVSRALNGNWTFSSAIMIIIREFRRALGALNFRETLNAVFRKAKAPVERRLLLLCVVVLSLRRRRTWDSTDFGELILFRYRSCRRVIIGLVILRWICPWIIFNGSFSNAFCIMNLSGYVCV